MREGKSRRKWKENKTSTDTLLDYAKQSGNALSGGKPGIFKTMKQAWFGPMTEALISKQHDFLNTSITMFNSVWAE